MYTPKPIDTSKIKLDDELLRLTELIAENVHEVWAKERISQGWHYGKVRSDSEKTTPCLVPYSELPEEEKDYDRSTALETLRVLAAMGYKLVRDEKE